MSKEKGNYIFHKLDKYIGIPIVFIVGMFKIKKKIPDIIQRIAILNLGSIGDNVLMSASVSDIRKAYPTSEITVFTGTTNFEIVKLIPGINEVIKLKIDKPFESGSEIRKKGAFDVLIDFGPWPRINSIYSVMIKAKFKIGFYSEKQYRHYIYDRAVLHSRNQHELLNYRALISPIVKNPDALLDIKVIPSEKVDRMIAGNERIGIVHAWPGGYKSYMKEWDNRRWAELIAFIQKDFDIIFLTGAPADAANSGQLYRLIQEKNIARVNDIAGKLNLADTVYLISKARFVFSVNTGIAHVAAALDVPQICLHGPTNVGRWRPYSDRSVSVIPSKGTFGYLHFGNEYHLSKENCMENIDVETVENEYKKLSNLIDG